MGLFSKGKADLIISKTNFGPGETITGTAALNVDKPALAKGFSVSLIGEKKTTVRRRSSDGNYTTETETTRIYDFKQPLDGEREYCGATRYNFAIGIPQDILAGLQLPNGGGGGLFRFVQGNAPRYVWYVQAMLDIPKSLDVNKKVDITIDGSLPPPVYAQPDAGWVAPQGYPPPPYQAYPPPSVQNYPPPAPVQPPPQGYPPQSPAQNYPPPAPPQFSGATPAQGNSPSGLSPGCPSCGQPSVPGQAWCGNCGKPLPPPVPPASFCPSCRQANDPAARFCVSCGAALARNPGG